VTFLAGPGWLGVINLAMALYCAVKAFGDIRDRRLVLGVCGVLLSVTALISGVFFLFLTVEMAMFQKR